MRTTRTRILALLAAVCAAGTATASAQQPEYQQPVKKTITNENRLFQRFIEDGAVTESAWFEGQLRLQAFEHEKVYFVAPVLAVNVAEDLEFGGRFAIASVDPDRSDTETGFTDLDLYGKVRLTTAPSQFALGLILELPTGDEQESLRLGNGEIDVSFFGGMRRDFGAVSLVGSVGLRINQDPDLDVSAMDPNDLDDLSDQYPWLDLRPGASLEGETSVQLGGAFLFALTQRLVGVVEASYETERIDGAGSDFRLTLGGDYRWPESFALRIAVAGGTGASAPEAEVIASGVLFF